MEKQIKLEESGYTAHLKQTITFGEHQEMQAVLLSAAKGQLNPKTQQVNAEFDAAVTIDWTYAKMTIMVTKLVDKDGKEITANLEAMKALPMGDGQALEKEIDIILEAIKKKSEKSGTK